MSSDVKTIPLIIQTPPDDSLNCSTGCGTCGSTGCAGGFGVKAGSEKDVVYRNLFIFAVIGIVMLVSSYLIMKILTAILE
ncbi:MAG: hypothetical protein K0A90_01305 [Methanosarcinaceae archaeon]|nr:hypothetical protein [Methanosarcinaceae archaeon]